MVSVAHPWHRCQSGDEYREVGEKTDNQNGHVLDVTMAVNGDHLQD